MTMRPVAIRLAAVAFLVGFVLGVLVPKIVSAESSQTDPARVHILKRGDTLWKVAGTYGSGDPRAYIDQIVDLNHLNGGQVFPGQRLVLPH